MGMLLRQLLDSLSAYGDKVIFRSGDKRLVSKASPPLDFRRVGIQMKDCRLTLRTQVENTPQESNSLARRFAPGGIILASLPISLDPKVISLYLLLQTATLMFCHPGCLFFFYRYIRILGV
jgi:hypothetical protein